MKLPSLIFNSPSQCQALQTKYMYEDSCQKVMVILYMALNQTIIFPQSIVTEEPA
jgi:hypothetical protein